MKKQKMCIDKMHSPIMMWTTTLFVLAAFLLLTNCSIARLHSGGSSNQVAQCKLKVGPGFTITKLDGAKKTAGPGRTVTIPAGKHTITYDHSFMQVMTGMPYAITDYGKEIEFEFEAGKSYKLIASPEIESFGVRRPGPTQITEVK